MQRSWEIPQLETVLRSLQINYVLDELEGYAALRDEPAGW